MKRAVFILTPVFLVIAGIYGLLKYFHPQIESFVIHQVRSLSAQHLPVEISLEHVNLHLIPLGVELTGLTLVPAADQQQLHFSSIEINALDADLDILQLLVGRVAISTLQLSQLNVDWSLDSSKKNESSKNKSFSIDDVFSQLQIIPVHQLLLQDFSFHVGSKELGLNISAEDSNALLINNGSSLTIETDLDISELQFHQLEDSMHLRAGVILRRNEIDIPQFDLTTSFMQAKAHITLADLKNIFTNPNARIQFTASTDLNKLHEVANLYHPLPKMQGRAQITADVEFAHQQLQIPQLQMHIADLKVHKFDIGEVDLQGIFNKDTFHTKTFQITNSGVLIDFPKLEVHENGELKTTVQVNSLDLHQALKNLSVGDLPIDFLGDGQLQCEGQVLTRPTVNCTVKMQSQLFEAHADTAEKPTIVEVDEFTGGGSFQADLQQIQFQADMNLGKSSGHSHGTVIYDQGFNISYHSDNVDLSDIDNLANLKMEGKVKLSGHTNGDSHHGEFFIEADGQDIWFEDFFLGNPKASINYKKGLLKFENVISNINSSRYKAQVAFAVNDKTISLEGHGENLDVNDVLFSLQRKFKLPVELNGMGNADIKASGPLDLSRLSYQMQVHLQGGSIAGESFDSGEFAVTSVQGEVQSNIIQLKKDQALITGTGKAHPSGQVELNLQGKDFLLEESQTVTGWGTDITGEGKFTLLLRGFILHPDVYLDAQVNKLTIAEQEFPPSNAKIKINQHGVQGRTNLFGDKLRADFVLPFKEEDPFHLIASARDWNFATVFAMLGGGFLLSEYQASLTAEINLHAPTGGFFNATGDATIFKAQLKRGELELNNPGPIQLQMQAGHLSFDNFRLVGADHQALEISSNNSRKNQLDFKARAHVPLHLLQIFFPFLEELSGMADAQTTLGGSFYQPELLGTGKISNGFIKLKYFPHAFEKLNVDAQFSQTKILLNHVNGSLAGGIFNGDGTLTILGLRNVATNVKAHFENITLNVPDKMQTSGFGDVSFAGNWFPFTLAGTYHVTSGMITKEIENVQDIKTTQQSAYLPKALRQSTFEPLVFNLQILFDQPVMVKNTLIDGSFAGNLLVVGRPTAPVLSGKLFLEKSTKITYGDKIFDIATATFTFTDPKIINPALFISAQSHVMDYDINLTVQGTAQAPVIRMTSQPPLPEPDIVSLLALGITTSNLDDKGGLQQHDQQQGMITQAGAALFNQISKDAQKALAVDLQVSSQYDDTKNMAIQKYSLSRKVTDKITFYSVLTRGDEASTTLQLKYAINPQLSFSTFLETVEPVQTGTSTETQPPGQILGIDLEFKREFKWQ